MPHVGSYSRRAVLVVLWYEIVVRRRIVRVICDGYFKAGINVDRGKML
jgi:hypothetical protein